jgi:hypothetical protein
MEKSFSIDINPNYETQGKEKTAESSGSFIFFCFPDLPSAVAGRLKHRAIRGFFGNLNSKKNPKIYLFKNYKE